MATAKIPVAPDPALKVARLDDDIRVAKDNEHQIIETLKWLCENVATKGDLAQFATKDDLKNGLAGLEQRIMAKLDNMG